MSAPVIPLPLHPNEAAHVVRRGPYIAIERMMFLTPEQAREIAPPSDWQGPIRSIQQAVSDYYGIDPKHMTGPSRKRPFAWPRQRAMWLAKELTRKHWTDLGRLFGDRNHATIIQGVRSVTQRMAEDPVERADMQKLLASLEHVRRAG